MIHKGTDKVEVISSVDTVLTVVSKRVDGIIEIRFKKDEYEVTVADQLEIEQAILSLTNGGHLAFHILVVPGFYGSITKEAREMEMFSSDAYKNQKSISVVIKSFPNRLLGKVYFSLKRIKPTFPHKLFNTEDNAVHWIRELDALNTNT